VINEALIAYIGAVGAVVGSVVTALVYVLANRKNTLTSALHNAAQSLDITTKELVESMLAAKQCRDEKDTLKRDYNTLKIITGKLYDKLVEMGNHVGLSDYELEMLYDTQPLKLLAEKSRRSAQKE
jgi:hypothetical protein